MNLISYVVPTRSDVSVCSMYAPRPWILGVQRAHAYVRQGQGRGGGYRVPLQSHNIMIRSWSTTAAPPGLKRKAKGCSDGGVALAFQCTARLVDSTSFQEPRPWR